MLRAHISVYCETSPVKQILKTGYYMFSILISNTEQSLSVGFQYEVQMKT